MYTEMRMAIIWSFGKLLSSFWALHEKRTEAYKRYKNRIIVSFPVLLGFYMSRGQMLTRGIGTGML